MWTKEIISDTCKVYIRVGESFISKDNNPRSAAFSNTPKEGDNLSSDWNKYCTPESSRLLIGKQRKGNGEFKDPTKFFIWAFNVGQLRTEAFPKQNVLHEPEFSDPENISIPNNRAHSIILGEKQINVAEFRVSLLKCGHWAIPPEF